MRARWLILGILWAMGWGVAAGPASASWQMDPRRFHVSAHGQLSCLECHQAVAQAKAHPDPARVNLDRKAEFKPQRCYECHDGIAQGLKEGRHGRRTVQDSARYGYCLRCHDPHATYAKGADQPGQFVAGLPRSAQCGACHEQRKQLPAPADDIKQCLACHAAGGDAAQAQVCLGCHGEKSGQAVKWPTLAKASLGQGPHADLACLTCHQKADRFPHNKQELTSCLGCHTPHHEKDAGGDLHWGVDCAGCHMDGMAASRDAASGRVSATPLAGQGPSPVHRLLPTSGEESCRRCHQAGNQVGAAAMVLPAKSIMCMPCHTATLSVGDTTTMVALAIFILGVLGALTVWLGGQGGGAALGAAVKNVFSPRLGAMAQAFILDGIFQRRLWRLSPARGLIHALIFWPFVLRFTWGIIALALNLIWPECPVGQALVRKNHPATALFFDLTGLMVVAGVLAALGRRLANRGKPSLPGLPGPDWPALILLAGIVVMGFVLEAARIAMTQSPPGAEYAFMGYILSRVLGAGQGLTSIYGYLWYIHAILTGAFVAYLPFSRMFHIIVAPLALAIRAGEQAQHGHEN